MTDPDDQPAAVVPPEPFGGRGAVGTLDRGDVFAAAKAGTVAELAIQVIRPAAEDAVRHHANALLERVADLPPLSGFLAGAGLRLSMALLEHRGSLWASGRIVVRWLGLKLKTWRANRRKAKR